MKRKTKLTKLGRDPIRQKGFINPGTYKGSTMIFKSYPGVWKTEANDGTQEKQRSSIELKSILILR